jgi:hypothetical protein
MHSTDTRAPRELTLLSERSLVVVTRNSTYRFDIGRSYTKVHAIQGGEVLEGLGTNCTRLPDQVYAAWGVQGLPEDIGASTRLLVDALVGKPLTFSVSSTFSGPHHPVRTSTVLAAYWATKGAY